MTNSAPEDGCGSLYQRGRSLGRADADAQISSDPWLIKPANKNLSPPKLFKPILCRELRRLYEDEVGLTGLDFEAEFAQGLSEFLAHGDDSSEVCLIIGQIVQSRR